MDTTAKTPLPHTDESWLTIRQLAEKLGKTERYVRKLVGQGLPCIKLSERATWFVWAEVAEWLRLRSAARTHLQQSTGGLHADHWQ